MDVLIVLVFVSIVLVAGSLLLLLFSLHQRDFEHADRLALLPLLDASSSSGSKGAATTSAAQADATTDTQHTSIPQKP